MEFDRLSYEAHVELIQKFVQLYEGRARQRSDDWLAQKRSSIGGSEIAALMGANPYSSFEQIVGAKSDMIPRGGGSIACWWGTMFESAIERFVEIDCGIELAGTDISVPAPEGSGLTGLHANSPDGYGAIRVFLNDEGEWQLLTTDERTKVAADGQKTKTMIALLEFKCPYRRFPKGSIPKHYKPQIWSGLALSPIAHVGMFVDAAFRKCSLLDLGPTAQYDRDYHRERTNTAWSLPIAWGLTGIYAPRLGSAMGNSVASSSSDMGFINPAQEAWSIYHSEHGYSCATEEWPDPIDLGTSGKFIFEKVMGLLDEGLFIKKHIDPCFADGRGSSLQSGRDIGMKVDSLKESPPAGFYLLGVLPWKIYEVCYAFLERRPGFLEEIFPLVQSSLDHVHAIRTNENPRGAYFAFLQSRDASPEKSCVTEQETFDLFDAVTTTCGHLTR